MARRARANTGVQLPNPDGQRLVTRPCLLRVQPTAIAGPSHAVSLACAERYDPGLPRVDLHQRSGGREIAGSSARVPLASG